MAIQQPVPDRPVTEVSEQLQIGVLLQLASCGAALQKSDERCPARGDERLAIAYLVDNTFVTGTVLEVDGGLRLK